MSDRTIELNLNGNVYDNLEPINELLADRGLVLEVAPEVVNREGYVRVRLTPFVSKGVKSSPSNLP